MRGKLIVFEGIDGSGKSTQFDMMCEKLNDMGCDYKRLVFPQYEEPSSALIKMYLEGQFGTKPGDVNAYAASAFYAVDRYASYVKVWRDYYIKGGTVLADRYTTSNAIHQASKLPADLRMEYLRWLEEFEYKLMGLPQPDKVVYMDIPLETATENMRLRELRSDKGGDIHETDNDYLSDCLEAAQLAAEFYGWSRVRCTCDGKMRPMDDIHDDILELIFQTD